MVHEIDPEGVSERLASTIQRRVYSVPCPNFVWHIDGAHKLINWKFVIHAGIDGFSRAIVFLQCSNNNRANTVTQLFLRATEQYGWPIRVRTDYGGENIGLWDQMNGYRGEEKRPVAVGSSVHNVRVERLHRDTNVQVGQTFKALFLKMESDGMLDRNNDADLFCLHYAFLPVINKKLAEFREAHNNHAISTEGNRTPNQLFFLNHHLLTPFENADAQEPFPGCSVADLSRSELPHVNVHHIEHPISRHDFRRLQQTLTSSHDFTIDEAVMLYRDVSQFVRECLTSGNAPM